MAFYSLDLFKGRFSHSCATENIFSFIPSFSKYSWSVYYVPTPVLALWVGAPLAEGPGCVLRWSYSIRLDLLGTGQPKPCFYFSLLGRECLTCACPTTVFWKQPAWFYRFTAGEEFFFLRLRHTSSHTISDLDDISMRLWTLDFRVDAGMS